jgi:ribosomal protein S18 acetylase RimI-like enzyme
LAAVPTISIASPPDPAADAVVTNGLRAHLVRAWGDTERSDVSVYLRDDAGEVVGGIVARIAWGWLYVERLWIAAAHRGRGHGVRLLEAAETHAVERGCRGVHLDTFGDEALPFYRRCQYEVWGTLEGLPPGGRQHFLRKRLPNG